MPDPDFKFESELWFAPAGKTRGVFDMKAMNNYFFRKTWFGVRLVKHRFSYTYQGSEMDYSQDFKAATLKEATDHMNNLQKDSNEFNKLKERHPEYFV